MESKLSATSIKRWSSKSQVKVNFIVCPKNVNISHITKAVSYLSKKGFQAKITFLDNTIIRTQEIFLDSNIYVPKVLNEFGIYYLASLNQLGAQLINSYQGIVTCRDKVLASLLLSQEGIRIPLTYLANSVKALKENVSSHPLIIKPFSISKGFSHKGACIVRDEKDLRMLKDTSGSIFAQQLLSSDGWDRKIYVIGEKVYGKMRPSFSRYGHIKNFHPPKELVDLALKIGKIFNLSIYGVDLLQSQNEFYVIDVNDFPSFRGISEAPKEIANLIVRKYKQ